MVDWSSMKSPRCESSSSPIGVSIEIGSLEILRILRIFSSGISMRCASVCGSRACPVSCRIWREMRFILLMVSIMCTGMRMVRAWSAIERVMAWRIHHVAYVENLEPRRYSNLSTAFMRPMLPSWIRSRNCKPRFVYFLAMEMTRRRFASGISRLARAVVSFPPLPRPPHPPLQAQQLLLLLDDGRLEPLERRTPCPVPFDFDL